MAGWQNDPNPVIGNPPAHALKSTLTGDLRKKKRKTQFYRIKPVIVLCDCTLRFTTNSLLPSVFLSHHLCLSFSCTHTLCSLICSFVLSPFRAPVLQERGVSGVSTGPLCSFPLRQNRDVQNRSQRQDHRSEMQILMLYRILFPNACTNRHLWVLQHAALAAAMLDVMLLPPPG